MVPPEIFRLGPKPSETPSILIALADEIEHFSPNHIRFTNLPVRYGKGYARSYKRPYGNSIASSPDFPGIASCAKPDCLLGFPYPLQHVNVAHVKPPTGFIYESVGRTRERMNLARLQENRIAGFRVND